MQDLFQQMRKEILTELTKMKKDQKASKLKAKTDSLKEFEVASASIADEVKKCQDKILKLANQFDKELIERDKLTKKSQIAMWDDIQQLFT